MDDEDEYAAVDCSEDEEADEEGEEQDEGRSESDDDSGAAGQPWRLVWRPAWSAEEDVTLRVLHAQHAVGRLSDDAFWEAAKTHFPSRTEESVVKRLSQSLLPVPSSSKPAGGGPQTDCGQLVSTGPVASEQASKPAGAGVRLFHNNGHLLWTAEEEGTLRALHAQHLAGQLSDDAFWSSCKEHFPSRKGLSIHRRLDRMALPVPPHKPAGTGGVGYTFARPPRWTEEESKTLRGLHAQHLSGRLSRDDFWLAVKTQIPSRTPGSAIARLQRMGLRKVPLRVARSGGDESDSASESDKDGDCVPAGGGASLLPARVLWTEEEDRRALALYAQHMAGALSLEAFWDAVVTQLPSRTAQSTGARLIRLGLARYIPKCREKKPLPARYWSEAEDCALRALHAQHAAGRLSTPDFWASCAAQLPSRTSGSVERHLERLALQAVPPCTDAHDDEGGEDGRLPRAAFRAAAKAQLPTRKEDAGEREGGTGKVLYTAEEDAHLLAEAESGRHATMTAVAGAVAAKSASRGVDSLLRRLKRLKTLGRWPGLESRARLPQPAAEEGPLPVLPAFDDLPPPQLWMLRSPSTGKLVGPYQLSALRRCLRDGDITALEARHTRAWLVGASEAESLSLQAALELPKQRSRLRQLERLRERQQRHDAAVRLHTAAARRAQGAPNPRP